MRLGWTGLHHLFKWWHIGRALPRRPAQAAPAPSAQPQYRNTPAAPHRPRTRRWCSRSRGGRYGLQQHTLCTVSLLKWRCQETPRRGALAGPGAKAFGHAVLKLGHPDLPGHLVLKDSSTSRKGGLSCFKKCLSALFQAHQERLELGVDPDSAVGRLLLLLLLLLFLLLLLALHLHPNPRT